MVAAGESHSVASTSEGELRTWGNGFVGQLGHGDREDRTRLAKLGRDVFCGSAVTMVSCGSYHTIDDRGDGGGEALYVWVWIRRPAGARRQG